MAHLDQIQTVLLIPTLETRDFLPDLFNSLKNNIKCFDQVIISCNGTSASKVKNLISSYERIWHKEPIVLCTGNEMSAMRHACFIAESILGYIQKDSLIYLLCDDDLLPPSHVDNYINLIKEKNKFLYPNYCIGIGSHSLFENLTQIPVTANMRISPGELIPPLEFLRRTDEEWGFTSVSGMIVPYEVYRSAILYMSKMRSSGRQTEYTFATHPKARLLYSPVDCSAFCRVHPGQETLHTYKNRHLDDLIYILWTWINQSEIRPFVGTSSINHLSLHSFLMTLVDLIIFKSLHYKRQLLAPLSKVKKRFITRKRS